ncbi:ethylene-responsive transcription factor RAP2-13-like [Aegilops tauschii subsp. strangulata]|uniref:ethylene-responsive transcription factor RAP2-13-like n=1 Tax=Aegilops tauschii subsp. strangulata TaxID=200361 RepID=UPI00098AABA6|nr:ethylene-responsive transcription factor RAP2-13-like [Aegilops tauschii subsp. strangulata]
MGNDCARGKKRAVARRGAPINCYARHVSSIALHLATPPTRYHAAAPPGIFGQSGVRQRPSGAFYAENRSGDVRLGLDTFETAHEAARAYNAAAWRLGRPRPQMNFQDVWTCEQVQAIAPSAAANN